MKRRNFIHAFNLSLASSLLFSTKSFGRYSFLDLSLDEKELAHHKIDAVLFSRVKMNYPRLVGKNARLDLHGQGPDLDICVIKTDQGAMGWASLRGSKQDAEKLVAQLIGKKVAELFSPKIGTLSEAHIPFDLALHDLAGVILQKPVYELLGRKEPFLTKYYSGMIYFDDLEPKDKPAGIDKILEECKFDYSIGYRQFKLKIGRGHKWMPKAEGLQRDIEVTKAVANAFPDCEILVDGNNGFTCDEFISYLKGIEGIKLFWIEEPFHETVEDYKKLREYVQTEKIDTLLADGEADPDQAFLKQLFQQKLLDVQLTDIEGLGFSNWRKMMPELVEMETKASPHAWGSLLKTNYTAHLAGGLGNTVTIEGVTSSSTDMDLTAFSIKDGKLIPPALPGFGMQLLKTVG